MALITDGGKPTKKDKTYWENERKRLSDKSKEFEKAFINETDPEKKTALLDSVSVYDKQGSIANDSILAYGGKNGQLTSGSNPPSSMFGDDENVEMPGMGGLQSVLGLTAGALTAGAVAKMKLPRGSFSTDEFKNQNPFKRGMQKTSERFKNLNTFNGTQKRIADEFSQGIVNKIVNNYEEGVLKNKSITQQEFKDITKNIKSGIEDRLKANPGEMKKTYKKAESSLLKQLNKQGVKITTTPITPPTTATPAVNSTTATPTKTNGSPKQLINGRKPLMLNEKNPIQLVEIGNSKGIPLDNNGGFIIRSGKPGTLSMGGLSNEGIEKIGNSIYNSTKGAVKTATSLPVISGVNSFLNYVDNDAQDPYNSAGNLIKGTAKTAYDFNPVKVTRDLSGLVLDGTQYLKDKRNDVINNKSIQNVLNTADDIRNIPIKVLNKVASVADDAMVETANKKFDEEMELRQRDNDKKFIKKMNNEKSSNAIDYLNVATKGMNTMSSQKSFDNMLVDMGYNPNEMTQKQKMKILNTGRSLIKKKMIK